jgi:hypothetical protein
MDFKATFNLVNLSLDTIKLINYIIRILCERTLTSVIKMVKQNNNKNCSLQLDVILRIWRMLTSVVTPQFLLVIFV